jgi:hypothetical protein
MMVKVAVSTGIPARSRCAIPPARDRTRDRAVQYSCPQSRWHPPPHPEHYDECGNGHLVEFDAKSIEQAEGGGNGTSALSLSLQLVTVMRILYILPRAHWRLRPSSANYIL